MRAPLLLLPLLQGVLSTLDGPASAFRMILQFATNRTLPYFPVEERRGKSVQDKANLLYPVR